MHFNSEKGVFKRDVLSQLRKTFRKQGENDDDFQIILYKIMKKNE